jgi:hypothetical protein
MSAANGFHVSDRTQHRVTREEDGSEFKEVTLYVYSIDRRKYLTRGELEAELDALHAFRQKEAHSQSEKATPGADQASTSPKLTTEQERTLKTLACGWTVIPGDEIMLGLKKMGLIELDDYRWMWIATPAGRAIVEKL